MNCTILWSAAVASMVIPFQADQSSDHQELQGVWALRWGVVDGKQVPTEEARKTVLAFRGNRIASSWHPQEERSGDEPRPPMVQGSWSSDSRRSPASLSSRRSECTQVAPT